MYEDMFAVHTSFLYYSVSKLQKVYQYVYNYSCFSMTIMITFSSSMMVFSKFCVKVLIIVILKQLYIHIGILKKLKDFSFS